MADRGRSQPAAPGGTGLGGSRQVGTLSLDGSLRDVAGRRRRRRPAPASHSAWTSTTTGGSRSRSRATGGRRRPSPTATARCCTAPASSWIAGPAAGAATGWSSTASSTRPTCGSTVPTSATPRATSSPTPTRSPTWLAWRPSTCSPWRWPAARSPTGGEAEPHRGSSSTGTAWIRRGTRVGCGGPCGWSAPARCASSGCGSLCRDANEDRANVMIRADLDSDEPRMVRIGPPWTATSSVSVEHAAGQGHQRRSSGPSASTTRGCGGRTRWATNRSRDLEVTVSVERRAQPRPRSAAHRAAAGRAARTGC